MNSSVDVDHRMWNIVTSYIFKFRGYVIILIFVDLLADIILISVDLIVASWYIETRNSKSWNQTMNLALTLKIQDHIYIYIYI